MSMPTFPSEALNITRDDAVNMILASIAMEELSLSHILNAEGEKIQYVLGTLENGSTPPEPPTVEQIMQVNNSVQKLLETTMYKTMFLKSKMSDALEAVQNHPTPKPVAAVYGEFASDRNNEEFGGLGGSLPPFIMPLDTEVAASNNMNLENGSVRVDVAGVYAVSANVSVISGGNINEAVGIQINDMYLDYNTFRVSDGTSSYTGILTLNAGDLVSLALVSQGPITTSAATIPGSEGHAYILTLYKIGEAIIPI